MPNLVSRLTVQLIDHVSGPSKGAAGSLKGLAGSFDKLASAGGSGKMAGAMKRVIADIEALEKIGEFRNLKRGLADASQAFRLAQQYVRQLKTAITDSGTATRAQEAALRRAVAAADSAKGAWLRQGQAVRSAMSGLQAAGVTVNRLADHETRLRRSIELTNNSLSTRFGHFKTALAGSAVGRLAGSFGGAAGIGALGAGGTAFAVGKAGLTDALALERAMYDVSRATDTSGTALAGYQKQLESMSLASGARTTDLASMLAAAGFAGRPKGDLLEFTGYANKAMTAWGTNAEATGQALAELGNIYQANQKRIEEIGDAVNTVADQSAAKETDLIEVLRRAGAAGRGLGISAEQTLAFAGALKEVGTQPEVIGTALNALYTNLSLGDGATKEFADGLRVIGTNSQKLQASVRKNATGAIVELLEKLERIPDNLKRMEALKNLFGREYADNMGALLNNISGVKRLLDTMGDRKNYVGSVDRDAQKKLETDFNKLDRAQRALEQFSRNIGNPLKIAAGSIAAGVNSIFEASQKAVSASEALQAATRRLVAGTANKDDLDTIAKSPDGRRVVGQTIRQNATEAHVAGAAKGDALIAAGADPVAVDPATRRSNLTREIEALNRQIAMGEGGANARYRRTMAQRSLAAIPPASPAGLVAFTTHARNQHATAMALEKAEADRARNERVTSLTSARDRWAPGSIERENYQRQLDAESGQREEYGPTLLRKANVPQPTRRPVGSTAGRVTPDMLRTDALDQVKAKASDARAEFDALGNPINVTVETTALDLAKAKAGATKTEFDALGNPISVHVETSSLDQALNKAKQLQSILSGVGPAASGVSANVRRTFADIGVSE